MKNGGSGTMERGRSEILRSGGKPGTLAPAIRTSEAKPTPSPAPIYTSEPKPGGLSGAIHTGEPKPAPPTAPIHTHEAKSTCLRRAICTREPKPPHRSSMASVIVLLSKRTSERKVSREFEKRTD
jgi:hypothetical protein